MIFLDSSLDGVDVAGDAVKAEISGGGVSSSDRRRARARAKATAPSGPFRVLRWRHGALGILFIGAGVGNLGATIEGIGRRWQRPVDAARRGTLDGGEG